MTKNEEISIVEKMSKLGAIGYSLWYTNIVFLLVVIVLGHHLLGNQPQRFAFPVSAFVGGFAAEYMASLTSSKKKTK